MRGGETRVLLHCLGAENRGAEVLGGEQDLQETVQGGVDLVSALSSAADLEVCIFPTSFGLLIMVESRSNLNKANRFLVYFNSSCRAFR
jgi:hypothetical protein